ncbi:MAG: KpsF/GutQ family sugar-phosphate isomerase [Pirellulaceae bacterium]
MSSQSASIADSMSADAQLQLARDVLQQEAIALTSLASRIDGSLVDAVRLLAGCGGSVVLCGMGKAGLIAQKIAATFASTGTRSQFLHPAEALHGDLGRVAPGDVAVMLSASGETAEVVALLAPLREMQVRVVAITCRAHSTLARAADVLLDLGPIEEACNLGLAPTTTTTSMLALGDAVALVLSRLRRFTSEDFARYHPGGSLGRRLARVDDVMRPLDECRFARAGEAVRDVLVRLSSPGRRTGAIMITDEEGALVGIFTDSDLARILERRQEAALDGPLSRVMTSAPRRIESGCAIAEAMEILAEKKISELPVVDAANRPVGLIDITDVVSLLPMRREEEPSLPHRCKRNGEIQENAPSTVPFRTKA